MSRPNDNQSWSEEEKRVVNCHLPSDVLVAETPLSDQSVKQKKKTENLLDDLD